MGCCAAIRSRSARRSAIGRAATLPCLRPEASGPRPVTRAPCWRVSPRMPGLRALPAYDHLWHAIRAAAADPDFAPVVDWLRVDETTPARVAATTLALYAATMDFAGPPCPHGRALGSRRVAGLSRSHATPVFLAIGRGLGAQHRVPGLADPRTARRDAAAALPGLAPDQEHGCRVGRRSTTSASCFSASEEEKVYGDRLYRVVAARRVGLVA